MHDAVFFLRYIIQYKYCRMNKKDCYLLVMIGKNLLDYGVCRILQWV